MESFRADRRIGEHRTGGAAIGCQLHVRTATDERSDEILVVRVAACNVQWSEPLFVAFVNLVES